MIKQEIQGQTFYICEHDNLVFEKEDEHKCPHALIGECQNHIPEMTSSPIENYNKLYKGLTVDLDRYGNCTACGSHHVTGRRAKWTHVEVCASDRTPRVTIVLRGAGMGSILWRICNRISGLAHTALAAVLPESSF